MMNALTRASTNVSMKSCALAAAILLVGLSGSAGRAAADDAAASAVAVAPAKSTTNTSDRLQEVTVTARRLDLTPRVSNFVNRIAAAENSGEGLARWAIPRVCPLVSGLSREDGEFILGRLSEIARAAGVPLADENCRPNLYVLISDQPAQLLRAMEKRNRPFTFGYDASHYPPIETPSSLVDEFIDAPRAIKVWYNSSQKDAWGKPISYCRETDLLPMGDPSQYVQCGPGTPGGSHLQLSTIWSFSRVFVIVDRTRLRGVTAGQLADYVAMSGLAKLKPGAQLNNAPTILKLFDAGAQGAPAGLSEWDETFLKSLYATDQKSRLQRSQITRRMVREIAP